MQNTIDKIHDIAEWFVQFEDPNETVYFRHRIEALSDFFLNSPITIYSITNTYTAANSGVISIAFIDEDGALQHENFPWWEEC